MKISRKPGFRSLMVTVFLATLFVGAGLAQDAPASSAKSARSTTVTIALLLLALGVGAGVLWMVRRVGVALKDLAARMNESAERASGGASMVSSSSQSLAA